MINYTWLYLMRIRSKLCTLKQPQFDTPAVHVCDLSRAGVATLDISWGVRPSRANRSTWRIHITTLFYLLYRVDKICKHRKHARGTFE